MKEIIEKVCSLNGLTLEDIRKNSKKQEVLEVRQFASWLAYQKHKDEKKVSQRIGEIVNRSRCGTIWSINRVQDRLDYGDAITSKMLDACVRMGLYDSK